MPDPAVWTIEANQDVRESYGYLTDVMAGYDETEQRVSLRAVPLEGLEFSALATDAREAGLAESLIHALQDEAIVVPYWQYGSRLSGAVGIGASLLPIADALDVPYRAAGYAVVWRDPYTWELFTVASTSGAGVATSDTATIAWASGSALVFPGRLMRIASRSPLDHESATVASSRFTFEAETAEPTAAAAESLPLYRALPVLTVVPDRGSATRDDVERRVYLLDGRLGVRFSDAPSAAPQTVRDFAWLCFSRAEARALREFVDARRGRARPFWMLAWQQDLELSADLAPGAGALTVRERGYTSMIFPAGNGRRHVAVRGLPGGAFHYRKVTASVDNGDGTETLTLDATVPDALPAATTFTTFLRFSRLEEDEQRIDWAGGHYASCLLPMRELTGEAPA